MHRPSSPRRPRTAAPPLPAALLALSLCAPQAAAQAPGAEAPEPPPRRPNVLLVIFDDLAPALGCYGEPGAHSPHLDRLAAEGVRFERAYAQYGLCGPSRESLLSGLRPESSRVVDLHHSYRDFHPDLMALPQLFREHGYVTAAMGKVHHGRGDHDDPKSWSVPPWRPEPWGTYYFTDEAQALVEAFGPLPVEPDSEYADMVPRVLTWERSDTPDDVHPDARIAARAIEFLREHEEEPFFLALGFLKPHLPFVAPEAAFAAIDAEAVRFPPPQEPPVDAPELALRDSLELRGFGDVPREGEIPLALRREMLVAYQACVSFVDSQLGRVLAELDRLELADDTIVVAFGDQGFHRGEQGIWAKGTLFEASVHVPLIVRAPGRARPGAASPALVELVDLYPTLAELAGLEAPAHLEGLSLAPLLVDPARPWKRAAFWSSYAARRGGRLVGQAMRTEREHYVEWMLRPANELAARELYDLSTPGARLVNRAQDPPQRHEYDLSRLLRRGWRAALPPEVARPR